MKTNNSQGGQHHIITHILLVITIIFIFTNYVFGQTATSKNGFSINNTGIAPQKKVNTLQPFGLKNSLMINFISPEKNSSGSKRATTIKKLSKQ